MTQMGIQVSSDFTERFTVEMIHRGDIGKVKEVHTFSNKKWGDMDPVPLDKAVHRVLINPVSYLNNRPAV
jgi:hypothetical protein